MKKLMMALLSLALLTGCVSEKPLRIGSKKFAENRILSEMFAALAREHGIRVKTFVPYGNTFDTHKGIREGDIELYPEYTGTALGLIGASTPSDEVESLERAKELYGNIDITWLPSLGFNNSFVLVMEKDEAVGMGISTIGDLAKMEEPVQIGCTEEFMARPVDGYQSLIRRYGFSPVPEVTIVRQREELFGMLVTGEVQVIVAQATDPQIEEFGLTVIEDNLEFFPAYECAPIIRNEALERFPAIKKVLAELAGKIDAETMRGLNRKVDLDGMEARAVAVSFLVEEGLLDKEPVEEKRLKLVAAIPPDDSRSKTIARALKAIRDAFPNRKVILQDSTDPREALIEGEALIAILGAEHFFEIDPGKLPRTKEDIEAIVPVGYHAAHILRPARHVSDYCFSGVKRLGVGPHGGSGEKVAHLLLDGYKETANITVLTGTLDEQIEAVYRGKLDALLIMGEVGQARIILALEEHPGLSLQPVRNWQGKGRDFRYPFLRQTRVPENTYPGVDKVIDTLGTQVVLAGPDPEAPVLGDGDPVSGIRTQMESIPRGYKEALARALDTREAVDPTLPAEEMLLVTTRLAILEVNPQPGVSALTAALVLIIGALLYLALIKKA